MENAVILLIIIGLMGYVIYRMYKDCQYLYNQTQDLKTKNEIIKLAFKRNMEFERKAYQIILEQYGDILLKSDKESLEGMIVLLDVELESDVLKENE